MAKGNQQGAGAPNKSVAKNQGGGGGNVVSISQCLAEWCSAKPQKANFCMEHFDWFKEGLITKEGKKPSDFDKKHFHYQKRLAAKKAA